MHLTSLYRGVPFIMSLSRSVSPRGINKQQLEIGKKEMACFIHTSFDRAL